MLLELSHDEMMMLHMCVDYRLVSLQIYQTDHGSESVYYADQVVKMDSLESLLTKISEVLHAEFVCSL